MLPGVLATGVPTGILAPIQPSGVWDVLHADEAEESQSQIELITHEKPWSSAQKDPVLARSLLMQDVDAGFAYILKNGFDEASQRWGRNVAAGKLGTVQVAGKKPRLIGDGSISGANGTCKILESTRLPGLSGVQRFLSLCDQSDGWVALSFDVAAAHKRVLVKEEEQGFGCFALGEEVFVYRSCYFGAKYSAYWWSRVGAWLVRMLHRFIYIRHGCFLYVDDGIILLPASSAPLLACACLAFLAALGVPLSWRKVRLGREIVWIGWKFVFSVPCASLPDDKRAKLLDVLQPLLVAGSRVRRKHVEHCVGILLWFCAGISWLRPWLQSFYQLLFKPHCVFRTLSCAQFGTMKKCLDSKLRLSADLDCCDLRSGWCLHSIGNSHVESLQSDILACPRVKRGGVECVFHDWTHAWVRSNQESVWAARLFTNAIAAHVEVPLRVTDIDSALCAADAFADSGRGGLGGWWLPPNKEMAQANVCWFSIQVSSSNLPKWFTESSKSFQSCIAALEALAQLMLLIGRMRDLEQPSREVWRMHQLCDNLATVAVSRKQLSMTKPLCYVLQAAGFYCCRFGIEMVCQHIAGVRNEWADALSRDQLGGFNPDLRVNFDVAELLDMPWRGHS